MRRTNCVRERTLSFPNTLCRWNSTVFSLRNSRVATSRFVNPATTASATLRSAGDTGLDDLMCGGHRVNVIEVGRGCDGVALAQLQ